MASELKPTTRRERDGLARLLKEPTGPFSLDIQAVDVLRLIADCDRLEEDYRRSLGVRDDLKCELERAHDILRRLVRWSRWRVGAAAVNVEGTLRDIVESARAEIEP